MLLFNGRTFSWRTYAMVLVPKCDDTKPRTITQTCQSTPSQTDTDGRERRRMEPTAGLQSQVRSRSAPSQPAAAGTSLKLKR